MAFGVIAAAALSMFQKRTLGDLVRALDREDANEPSRAMTLEQLGLIRNTAIKSDLRHGTALRRVVRCVEEENYLASQAEKKAASAPRQNQGGYCPRTKGNTPFESLGDLFSQKD